MTLIITQISKYGIIHASDSNLTASGQYAREAQKTFELPFLNAGLTLAGAYSVRGISMDVWMPIFINVQSAIYDLHLSQFAYNLKSKLEDQMFPHEKKRWEHRDIAGYVLSNNQYHPEFWFIRNVHR